MVTTTLDESINRQTYGRLGYLFTRQTFWVFLASVIAFLYLSYASDRFFTPDNLFNVARNCAFVGILGLGMTAVIITGGIDLSVGAVLCLGGMVCGMTMAGSGVWDLGPIHITGLNRIWVAIPAALIAASAAGGISGVLIAYIGMPPFVVTLGMMSVARSVAMVLSRNQMVYQFGVDHAKLVAIGGGSTRGWFNLLAAWVGTDTSLGGLFTTIGEYVYIPNPAVFLALLAVCFGFAFRWTRWGRYIFAIGGNEQAAILTGIPVRRIKLSVYILSGLMAGFAGILLVGWLGTITTGMGLGYELNAIAAVVIGGTNLSGGAGTAFGAVVGAVLFEMIRNSLTLLGINPFWQGTFIGTFLIVAILFDRVRAYRQSR